MDDVDIAQGLEEAGRRTALFLLRARRVPPQLGADCLECGAEIPARRRAAVPGCCLCVACQERAEKAMGR